MQIGDAARRAGLTVKTVRYYANIGLVAPQRMQKPAIGIMARRMWPSCNLSARHGALTFQSVNAASCWDCMRTTIAPAAR